MHQPASDHSRHDHDGHAHGGHGHRHSGHDHAGHGHGYELLKGNVTDTIRRVQWALMLTSGLMIVQWAGGLWVNSLALVADSAHMLSDAVALAATWLALRNSVKPPGQRSTFGRLRSESIAALFNAALLFVVAGGIIHESWERFSGTGEIKAGWMVGIAVGGLLVNVAGLLLLHRDRNSSLNMEGAWQHVIGDAAGSVCAIAAAAGILLGGPSWRVLDPIASFAVSILILIGACRLAKRTLSVLMENAPSDFDVTGLSSTLLQTPGVLGVHCLHVWTIASGVRAMSAHIVHETSETPGALLHNLHQRLKDQFTVEHITLQLETPGFDGCVGLGDWCRPPLEYPEPLQS